MNKKDAHNKREKAIISKTIQYTSGKTNQVKFYMNREFYALFKEACSKKNRSATSLIEEHMLHSLLEEGIL